jgi:hypothetical protein
LYAAQAAVMPGFAEYQRKTTRQIVVGVLERRNSQDDSAAKSVVSGH